MDETLPRRRFLLGAGLAGTAVATGLTPALPTQAEAQTAPAAPAAKPQTNAEPDTYLTLTATEVAFFSAAADTIIPADELSPSGTDCGIVTFIDRQLAGAWGGGAKMYRSGPFRKGKPEQGYQLPLTPAQLYRAGIEATNAHCRKIYGKAFDRLDEKQREEVLVGLSTAKITFDSGLPVNAFWSTVYQTVMQGMFSDPIYGGNRNKAGWKLIGFPGVVAVHRENVEKYRGKKYTADILGIEDLS